MEFRLLHADEIEVRVGGVTQDKGGFLLLYKDARSDMNILDETVGSKNWQRSHDLIDGQLFCTVSIYDKETNRWIAKQDVGVESYTDKEKGRASDSFKRACVNWGIGRELYTAPFIWINDKSASKDSWKYKKFKVTGISYDGGKIASLSISEDAGRNSREVYRFTKEKTSAARPTLNQKRSPEKKVPASEVSEAEIAKLWKLVTDMKGQFPEIETEFKTTMGILRGQENPTFEGISRQEFNALQDFISNKLEDFEREQTSLWGAQHG